MLAGESVVPLSTQAYYPIYDGSVVENIFSLPFGHYPTNFSFDDSITEKRDVLKKNFDRLISKAMTILKKIGIVYPLYLMPRFVCTTSNGFHRYNWVQIYSDNYGCVKMSTEFLLRVKERFEETASELAHEILHGMHDQAIRCAFSGVSNQEITAFRLFISKTRYVGFVEGLMQRIAFGIPDPFRVLTAARIGISDLSTLKEHMPDMQAGPVASLTPSYFSAQVFVDGFVEYVQSHKCSFIKHLQQNRIDLIHEHPESGWDIHNFPPEAILFRIVVQYMLQEFARFRKGVSQSQEFTDFFFDCTGHRFSTINEFARQQIYALATNYKLPYDQIRILGATA